MLKRQRFDGRQVIATLFLSFLVTLSTTGWGQGSGPAAQEPGLVQLTNQPGETAIHPNWSPKGDLISFINNRASNNGRMNDVWAVAPDGTNPHPLTAMPDDGFEGGTFNAVWIGSTGDLVVLDTNIFYEWLRLQLSQRPPLPVVRTAFDGPSPYFEELLTIPGGLGGNTFAVSRDGQFAAWSAMITPSSSCPWVTSAVVAPFNTLNGQATTSIGSVVASGSFGCSQIPKSEAIVGISFSPDNSQIVLARASDPNVIGYDLEIYTTSGQFVRKLTDNGTGPNPVVNWNPSWSADGRIAFASNKTGRFEIYTVNPDGSNLTPITTNGGDWPTFSPDGKYIAFQSDRAGNSEIYKIPIQSWARILGPWTAACDSTFGAVAVHPANSETVFIGSSHPTAGCGIYKTVDGGKTWATGNTGIEEIGVLTQKHFPAISDIAISQPNPNFLYTGTFVDAGFATFGTIFTSVDGGDTWHARSVHGSWFSRSSIGRPILTISVDPTDPQTALVGTVGEVVKTIDAGASWSTVLSGRIGLPGTPTDFYQVVRMAPFKGGLAYVSGLSYFSGPIFPCTLSGQCLTLDGILPLNPVVSTNGGASWANSPLPAPAALISDLKVALTNPETLYAGTLAYSSPVPGIFRGNLGIFRSSDGGQSWQAINNLVADNNQGSGDLSQFPIFQIALDPMFPTNLYAVAGISGVFKSPDLGNHWFQLTLGGFPTETFVRRIAVRGNRIYALTSNGVYVLN